MTELIKIAAGELGVSEIQGPGSNERIMTYAKETGFDSWYKDDDTAWCSLFMNWVALKSGMERTGQGRAESWLQAGKTVSFPEPGDIALFSSQAGGTNVTHVGIYMGYSHDKERIYVLGGNQSNAVNISGFKADKLVQFRRLGRVDVVDPVASLDSGSAILLKRGDKGAAVRELQDNLKLAGFDCGVSDGDYGGNTEKAIKALQAKHGDLSVTGVFDIQTRDYLTSLLDVNTR